MRCTYVRLDPLQRHLALSALVENYEILNKSRQDPAHMDTIYRMHKRLYNIPPKTRFRNTYYEWSLVEPHNILLKELNNTRNRWLEQHRDVSGLNEVMCILAEPKVKNFPDLQMESQELIL